jgi:hypothetical protein
MGFFRSLQGKRGERHFRRPAQSRFRRLFRSLPLRLELLEDRMLLATVSWDGGAGTLRWDDPQSWNTDNLPVSSDDAVIGTAFTGLTITHDAGSVSVRSLASAEAVRVTGGSFALGSATSEVDDCFTVSGGLLLIGNSTVNGAGSLINNATLQLSSGVINTPLVNQGTLLVRGDNGIGGPLTTTASSLIRVQADDIFSTFARLTVAQGFTNQGAIEITLAGGSNFGYDSRLDVTAGALVNTVSASIQSLVGIRGGNRQLNAALDNQGTLDVQQTLSISNSSRTFTNATGAVNVVSGSLLTNAGGSSVLGSASVLTGGGQIDLAGSHVLTLEGDLHLQRRRHGQRARHADEPGFADAHGRHHQCRLRERGHADRPRRQPRPQRQRHNHRHLAHPCRGRRLLQHLRPADRGPRLLAVRKSQRFLSALFSQEE